MFLSIILHSGKQVAGSLQTAAAVERFVVETTFLWANAMLEEPKDSKQKKKGGEEKMYHWRAGRGGFCLMSLPQHKLQERDKRPPETNSAVPQRAHGPHRDDGASSSSWKPRADLTLKPSVPRQPPPPGAR